MFQTPHATPSASSSNFHSILDAALKNYKKKTKSDLLAHQLTAQLQTCDSPSAILDVLNKQYNVQEFIQSQSGGEDSKQWLSATVTVLCAFSAALGEGVGLVFSPAKVIFSGICVLLTAAKDVSASLDALVVLFKRIENFFERFQIYTEVRLSETMTGFIVKVIVEVLEILAIATKEIKQGSAKKYLKRLVGKTDIEDALKRLENLTHDEALMATAQVLKVTHNIDDIVTGTHEEVRDVGDSVRAVIDQVTDVGDNVRATIDVGRETSEAVYQIQNNLDDLTRDQVRKGFQEWLSPADPTINYNTARDTYHDGTATWFTQSETFARWKEPGPESLLWIHGKPGSGKSIISSAIIHHIKTAPSSGPFSMAYFFFDFKDAAKQDARALLSSLLIQLSDQSDLSFKALFNMYSTHGRGTQRPSESDLSQCLKNILMIPGQAPIYLIVDAVDECPNTSKVLGAPRSRQRVLDVVKGLVKLCLPGLRICITSRPEFDIRNALEDLAYFKVSLHDQDGQKQDIAEYVRSVVYSDEEPMMKEWKGEVKDLVIKTLSEKADGMFRWVVYQLETLRDCLARNVPRVLSELPKSLEETYCRVLRGINEANQDDVLRLFQCLVVSIRPLHVEELAEILPVEFDDAEGVPKLNPDWRWEDQEQALQAACSNLIAIVDTGHSRVVQFSHFSVKEFLTSPRLADSSGDVSRYHISLEAAHTILAQACLGSLLRLDGRAHYYNVGESFPLAHYAARYWVDHAQFKSVSSRVRKGMESLFDPGSPHFAAWLRLHDGDTRPSLDSAFSYFSPVDNPDAAPLYYAALSGFYDITEHLITEYQQDVNARGGYLVSPLVVSLAGNYFQIAELLYHHGADVDVRGYNRSTPLHSASGRPHPEIVRWLLNHGADANVREDHLGWTPLFPAVDAGYLEVVRVLVEHKANINAQDDEGRTPLHVASKSGRVNIVRSLLGHGVDVDARNNNRSTPLHLASEEGTLEVVGLLIEHGANVDAEDSKGRTAFQVASAEGHKEVAKFLLEHSAE